MRNLDVIGEQRRMIAKTHIGDIRRLDRELKANKTRIRTAVAASGTTVTDIYGVGPSVAAFLIGYSGDVSRFATAGHYAAYNGTALIEVSSGGNRKHRLSLRGNRKLNHAIHMAAVSQIRYPHTPGRIYYDKKRTEGKTKKEALRTLKRRISDAVHKRLVADHGWGPGDTQERLVAFRPQDNGDVDILWQRELLPSAASTIVSDRQMLYVTDYVDGSNHLVVLDLMTGDKLLRVPTPATRATIGQILPTANGDVYISSNEPGQPTGFLIRIHVP